ncbi:unnamed protein product, partial [Amoebophrya sp. A120]|eukprot:GSA120T00017873001.1
MQPGIINRFTFSPRHYRKGPPRAGAFKGTTASLTETAPDEDVGASLLLGNKNKKNSRNNYSWCEDYNPDPWTSSGSTISEGRAAAALEDVWDVVMQGQETPEDPQPHLDEHESESEQGSSTSGTSEVPSLKSEKRKRRKRKRKSHQDQDVEQAESESEPLQVQLLEQEGEEKKCCACCGKCLVVFFLLFTAVAFLELATVNNWFNRPFPGGHYHPIRNRNDYNNEDYPLPVVSDADTNQEGALKTTHGQKQQRRPWSTAAGSSGSTPLLPRDVLEQNVPSHGSRRKSAGEQGTTAEHRQAKNINKPSPRKKNISFLDRAKQAEYASQIAWNMNLATETSGPESVLPQTDRKHFEFIVGNLERSRLDWHSRSGWAFLAQHVEPGRTILWLIFRGTITQKEWFYDISNHDPAEGMPVFEVPLEVDELVQLEDDEDLGRARQEQEHEPQLLKKSIM